MVGPGLVMPCLGLQSFLLPQPSSQVQAGRHLPERRRGVSARPHVVHLPNRYLLITPGAAPQKSTCQSGTIVAHGIALVQSQLPEQERGGVGRLEFAQ